VPACELELKRGTFTCVGWQVTLCDPIWQVTPYSSVVGVPLRAVHAFNFFFIVSDLSLVCCSFLHLRVQISPICDVISPLLCLSLSLPNTFHGKEQNLLYSSIVGHETTMSKKYQLLTSNNNVEHAPFSHLMSDAVVNDFLLLSVICYVR